MDFLICDSNRMEIGFLPKNATLDFDLGGEYNDVEITVNRDDMELDFGLWVVCPGTEYGALIEECEINTDDEDEIWRGNSFRKFLSQTIIVPPDGQDYYIASGDANEIIAELTGGIFGGLFTTKSEAVGYEYQSYKFDRYTTVLDGISKMLKSKDLRLKIEVIQGDSKRPFTIELSAVPIVDYSGELEWSENALTKVNLVESRRGINHLICLGQGELKDRMVKHLYLLADGSVSEVQYYKGLEERTEIYDYSSVESEDDLISEGSKKLMELGNYKEMTVTVDDMDIEIGDLVGGRSYEHNIRIVVPITQKIVKIENDEIEIEYKAEGA